MDKEALFAALGQPFPPKYITWKPGSLSKDKKRALAMAYADTRAYQERLDALFGFDWSTTYTESTSKQVICALTIMVDGREITRSATGEDTDLMSAEARAFKRACSAFGLGRYLYALPAVWIDYDAQANALAKSGLQELDRRYKAFYEKAIILRRPEDDAGSTCAAPKAEISAHADAGSPQGAPPWQAWQGPQDAYRYMLDNGLVNATAHAKNALRQCINDHFGGKLTTTNWSAVAECFYNERLTRQAEKQAVAIKAT